MMVAVVIPAWNEEKRIGSVLDQLSAYPYRVVVVDDGSIDGTAAVAEQRGVDVIRHAINRDYGAAIRTGEEYALSIGAEIIVHFDADGQHRAADIQAMIQPILDGQADVTLGSRFLARGNHVPFFKKYLILKPAVMLHNIFLGMSLTDTHNGLRAFSRDALLPIETTQDHMAFASEVLAEIKRLQLKVLEVPVTVHYREYGQGFVAGFKIFADLLSKKLLK